MCYSQSNRPATTKHRAHSIDADIEIQVEDMTRMWLTSSELFAAALVLALATVPQGLLAAPAATQQGENRGGGT